MAERVGCARLSEQAEEDLAGTASHVHRWVLVEQPGSWGSDAPRESRLPPGVAAALLDLTRAARARLLLIRRPGRHRPTGPRRAFIAVSRSRTRWIERIEFDDPATLLDLDLRALAADRSVGGQPFAEPLFLVCTNGAHDACCATRGRPLAAALAQIEPEATWESSHFGGDRFAGNLVSLPSGTYYGRVEPGVGARVVEAERAGRVYLPNLRGRSALPFAIQAADIALRRAHGIDHLDALRLDHHERVSERLLALRFVDADRTRHDVRVEIRHEGTPRMLSCGASPLVPPRFIVTDETGAEFTAPH